MSRSEAGAIGGKFFCVVSFFLRFPLLTHSSPFFIYSADIYEGVAAHRTGKLELPAAYCFVKNPTHPFSLSLPTGMSGDGFVRQVNVRVEIDPKLTSPLVHTIATTAQ